MADQNNRARSTAIIADRGICDRSHIAVTVDRGRDPTPRELAGERIKANRDVKNTAQQVDMRSRTSGGGIWREHAQTKQHKQAKPDSTRLHKFPLPNARG